MTDLLQRAVFLDRDGTLIEDLGYLSDPRGVRVYSGVVDGLRRLKEAGFRTVVVTNQSGIGRGYFTEVQYQAVHAQFLAALGAELIDATYFCGDHPDEASERRKPAPGMLLEAARDLGLDLARSWMIGDRAGDLEAGQRAGCRSILVRTGVGANAEPSGADFVADDFAAAAAFILQTEAGQTENLA
jgi:D-glycero-D-manno-heptose 1,7-bisphosphate phosphatase